MLHSARTTQETSVDDGGAVADLYSFTNRPTELYLDEVKATTSPRPEFFGYPWQDAPIVRYGAQRFRLLELCLDFAAASFDSRL